MIEIKGRYETAKCFTDNIDSDAIKQLQTLCNQTYAKDAQIRIMPDVHAGNGCVVGTTMQVTDKICPNLIGTDIGCGVSVYKLDTDYISYSTLDKVIREFVPSGGSINDKEQDSCDFLLKDTVAKIDKNKASRSLGTLGGGNHFIEIDRNPNGELYLIIHSGSRYMGSEIGKYYNKKEFLYDDISIPDNFKYLSTEYIEDYLHDIELAQKFATINRDKIAQIIVTRMKLNVCECFETVHNYIEQEDICILRKGAVSAQKGELLIIPFNMADGSILAIGKGNPDWNFSAPHGAGRVFSRAKAKEEISMREFSIAMRTVCTTSVCESNISEAPQAYKNPYDIMENIEDSVEIKEVLSSVYNFKNN